MPNAASNSRAGTLVHLAIAESGQGGPVDFANFRSIKEVARGNYHSRRIIPQLLRNLAMTKTGWSMTALLVLFMLIASVAPKLLGAAVAVDALVELDWPPDYLLLIGLIELACVALFVFPRTSLLGAILMTGLLGGALASHLRAGSPLFSHTLFGIYLGVFMWVALWLREEKLRSVFPLMRKFDD